MPSQPRRRRFLGPGSGRFLITFGLAALVLWFLGDVLGLRVFAGVGGGHADPVSPILMGLTVILLAAKIGGDIAERLKQPAVLGELLAGVVLGNVGDWLGSDLDCACFEHRALELTGDWSAATRSRFPGPAPTSADGGA